MGRPHPVYKWKYMGTQRILQHQGVRQIVNVFTRASKVHKLDRLYHNLRGVDCSIAWLLVSIGLKTTASTVATFC